MKVLLCLIALGLTSFVFSGPIAAQDENLFEPSQDTSAQAAAEDAAVPDAAMALAAGNTQFALEIYQKLANESGNIFISPLSVSQALSMVYAGAKGETADNISQVLHFPSTGEELLEAFSLLNAYLTADNPEASSCGAPAQSSAPAPATETPAPATEAPAQSSAPATSNEVEGTAPSLVLRLANSIWLQNDAKFEVSFTDAMGKYFQGQSYQVDFKTDEANARAAINDWASKATEGKITNLLANPLNILTKLVLVNAVYFKGTWQDSFEKELTQPAQFNLPTEKVEVPFMNREGSYRYFELDGAQVLELPYSGRKLSMLVILPPEGVGTLAACEKALTPENLNTIVEGLAPTKVKVSIPKFTITWGAESLIEPLKLLGLTVPFGEDADFSGMTGDKSLVISDIFHKAFVEVSEEGTEAAAATAAVAVTRATLDPPEVPVFTADRPFIFFIREKKTGSIIFMGRVVDPRTSS